MSNQQVKSLYLKFMKGECTPAEIELLIELLQSVDDVEGLPSLEEVEQTLPQQESIADASSDRIFNAIVGQDTLVTDVERTKKRQTNWLIAAAIISLLILANFVFYLSKPSKIIYQTDFAKKEKYQLPDGTKLLLNANTTIEINETFLTDKGREVWISGEAYFDVAQNKNKPFVVHTNTGMDVYVLGTTFNLKARSTETHVVLNRGSVKVFPEAQQDKAQLLVPGEIAHFHAEEARVVKSVTDTMYFSAWQYNLQSFKNEQLRNVAASMQDIYGYRIDFTEETLKNMHFTGALPTNDINKAIKTLAAALDCTINKENDKIIISTKRLIN